MKTDIAVIITAHKEAELLYPTFSSALLAVEKLLACFPKLNITYHIYLDNADEYTLAASKDLAAENEITILRGKNGDPGQARYDAISRVDADFIALLDGDDLWSENWLVGCWNYKVDHAEKLGNAFVLHPEYNLIFGAHSLLVRQGDMDGNWFDLDFLRVANYWDALCFAPRDVFLSTPYVKNEVSSGFAHEDYMWMCETLSQGVNHFLIKNAVHFKRRRSGSVSQIAEEKKVKVHFNVFSGYQN